MSRGRSPVAVRTPVAQAAELERAGDLAGAVAVFEAALARTPGDPDLLAGLAALAERMQSAELALSIWTLLRARNPERGEATGGVARALSQLGRHAEGAEILRSALARTPTEPGLWTSLGVIHNQQGDMAGALACFGMAIEVGGRRAAPHYNRGGVRLERGEVEAALEDFAIARRLARYGAERAQADFATGLARLSRGELEPGWRGYEARLSPARSDSPCFYAPGRMWTPAVRLDGAHLLALGEQGIGDQLMFANVLGDVLESLGPDGRLSVAVDPRLVDLVQRSFPEAQIVPLTTELYAGRAHHSVEPPPGRPVDLWAPLGSLLQRFRASRDAFPHAPAYLRPRGERVAHWRAWLGDGAPAVGLSWRSRGSGFERRRAYPAAEAWRPIFATPGIRLVNLQYDLAPGELAELTEWAGCELSQPPGLDLRNDLDDLAALCVALDRVVSIPNATGILAAACGADVGLLDPPAFWRRLGAAAYPWHPRARSYPAGAGATWDGAIDAVAADLRRLAARP